MPAPYHDTLTITGNASNAPFRQMDIEIDCGTYLATIEKCDTFMRSPMRMPNDYYTVWYAFELSTAAYGPATGGHTTYSGKDGVCPAGEGEARKLREDYAARMLGVSSGKFKWIDGYDGMVSVLFW